MLTINTNLSSLIAQGSMKSSTNKLNQAIERMTTGVKINHAKDNAANYSISTNMTTKIGAYMVAEDNVLQGLDMVSTASQNLSLIDDKLQRLRALAVQSSSGSYGEQSLKAINAEANALVDEINRTYSTSEYNGQKVFKNMAPPEIPDGIGTTGNVGVQPIATYSLRTTPSPRATDYGEFLADPYTYEQSYVDSLDAVSSIDPAAGFTESEYKIATVADLVALAELVNDEGLDTSGITFILAKDIDLSSISKWTPISTFKGTFDGNGNVIKNLVINEYGRAGLFSEATSGAEIKNLGIEGGSVNGGQYTGALVGKIGSSFIANCYAVTVVKGSYNTGGLVGYADSSTIMDSCTNINVTGSGDVGGLIGSAPSCSISNCYSTGKIKGSGNYANNIGGLAGNGASSITNSYATGEVSGLNSVGGLVGSTGATITNCYATGAVAGTGASVGGLVGAITTYASIGNSYAAGVVTGVNSVGGLVGTTSYYTSISNSCAMGNVTGSSNSVGGLVGQSSSSINNSYATGDVTGSDDVGGLLGSHTSPNSITDCYATGSVLGANFVGGLVGQIDRTSGSLNITNCLSYSAVSGSQSDSTGSLIGGAVVTTNNTTFGTINLNGCKASSQECGVLGGSYMYDNTTYTLLNSYDSSSMTSGVSLYKPEVTSLTLQVGANAPDSNQITFDMAFMLENVDDLRQIGLNTTADSLALCDSLIAMVNEKQTLYGAVENRLMSVLDEISTQYENLVSARSTIRDADMAEVSSEYIRQQILQQASATLLATANQSPSIALQLI